MDVSSYFPKKIIPNRTKNAPKTRMGGGGGAQNHGLLRRVRETTLCFPEVDIVAMFTKFRNVR